MTIARVQLRHTTEQRRTSQEIVLGGVRVRLLATYNGYSDRWYVSIYSPANVLLVGSIACVPGVDLLLPYKHLAIPQGQLFVHSRSREVPTFTTMDTTARVLYR